MQTAASFYTGGDIAAYFFINLPAVTLVVMSALVLVTAMAARIDFLILNRMIVLFLRCFLVRFFLLYGCIIKGLGFLFNGWFFYSGGRVHRFAHMPFYIVKRLTAEMAQAFVFKTAVNFRHGRAPIRPLHDAEFFVYRHADQLEIFRAYRT